MTDKADEIQRHFDDLMYELLESCFTEKHHMTVLSPSYDDLVLSNKKQ